MIPAVTAASRTAFPIYKTMLAKSVKTWKYDDPEWLQPLTKLQRILRLFLATALFSLNSDNAEMFWHAAWASDSDIDS